MKAKVKFDNPIEGYQFFSQNMGFQGRGWIEESTDSVVFSGKQRKFLSFGREAKVEIKFSEIINVERTDRRIRFDIQSLGMDRSSKFFSFRLSNEQEAQQVESFLPKTATEKFAIAREERSEFYKNLQAATPHVFVTQAIILTNILVFIGLAIAGAGLFQMDTKVAIKFLALNPEIHLRWGANFGPMTMTGQFWRLLTSTFIHFGIIHLLCNMWALNTVGQLVEGLYGNAFFLILYLASGVTGSVASIIWHPYMLGAGASGAIFGLYGGLLSYIVLQRKSVPPSVFKRLWISNLVFAVYSLYNGFHETQVDNAAHIGGLVAGVIVGLIFARPLNEKIRIKMSWRCIFAGLFAAVLFPSVMWIYLGNSGEAYKKEKRFQEELKWLAEEEKSINSSLDDMVKEARSGLIRDYEAALILEKYVLRWENAFYRLSKAKLDVRSPSNKPRNLALAYIALRRDAMETMVKAIKTNDLSKMDEYRQLQIKVNNMVEKIMKDVKKQDPQK